MGTGSHGNVILCNVNAYGKTFLIYVGKMFFSLFGVFVSNIQTNMIETVYFHFMVYCAGYDISRSK